MSIGPVSFGDCAHCPECNSFLNIKAYLVRMIPYYPGYQSGTETALIAAAAGQFAIDPDWTKVTLLGCFVTVTNDISGNIIIDPVNYSGIQSGTCGASPVCACIGGACAVPGTGSGTWFASRARIYGPANKFCVTICTNSADFTLHCTGGTITKTNYGPLAAGDYIEIDPSGDVQYSISILEGVC
jgi:hypothetical protein